MAASRPPFPIARVRRPVPIFTLSAQPQASAPMLQRRSIPRSLARSIPLPPRPRPPRPSPPLPSGARARPPAALLAARLEGVQEGDFFSILRELPFRAALSLSRRGE